MSEVEWLEMFSFTLKGEMKEYGANQQELAEDSGLSQSAISNYMNMRRSPSIYALINLAHALDCDVDDLAYFGECIEI